MTPLSRARELIASLPPGFLHPTLDADGREGLAGLVRDAIEAGAADDVQAERDRCAKIAGDLSADLWKRYKTGRGPERANDITQGGSIAAEQIEQLIRGELIQCPAGCGGFRTTAMHPGGADEGPCQKCGRLPQ